MVASVHKPGVGSEQAVQGRSGGVIVELYDYGGTTGQLQIEAFHYLSAPGEAEEYPLPTLALGMSEEPAAGDTGLQDEDARALQLSDPELEERLRAEFDFQLGEETRRAFEAGRQKGVEEGRLTEREVQNSLRAQSEGEKIRQMSQLVINFEQSSQRFMERVEHEVVELALSIAARILRREAQMDPLLLTGAVRVALGQLSGSTKVRLKVPATDLDLWQQAILLLPNLTVKPEVVAGEGMRLGDCLIETQFGSVDLGVRAQLGEIERGFFDRAKRKVKPAEMEAAEHEGVRA